jgi:hypothetical protein
MLRLRVVDWCGMLAVRAKQLTEMLRKSTRTPSAADKRSASHKPVFLLHTSANGIAEDGASAVSFRRKYHRSPSVAISRFNGTSLEGAAGGGAKIALDGIGGERGCRG